MSEVAVDTCACCEQPLTGGLVRLWPDTNIRICYDCIRLDEQPTRSPNRKVRWSRSGCRPRTSLQRRRRRAGGGALPATRIQDRVPRRELRICPLRKPHRAPHPRRSSRAPHDQRVVHPRRADRLATAWSDAGVTVDGPRNEDYGKREGQHVDPDGNLIRFGSPIPH